MAQYVYPAVFHPNEDDGSFTVTFPDLPGCITEGKSLFNALYMAQDALETWLAYTEDQKFSIPAPTPMPQVQSPEFSELVMADTAIWRKRNDSRSVKKTLSLPNWLNTMAEEANINFSQVLQKGLKQELHITD